MTPRLDPAVPMLWRTPTSVQFGSPPVLVLDQVTRADERLLATLCDDLPPGAVPMIARAHGLSRAGFDEVLELVRPALVPEPGPRSEITLVGDGSLASRLAGMLAPSHRFADADPALAVIVADWIVAPDDHGRWLRRDTPHLPVVASGRSIEVGPLVLPGEGACLYCVHLAQCDADPAWTAVATQLLRHAPPAIDAIAGAEACALVARAIDRALRGTLPRGTSWTIDAASGLVTAREWSRHPDCLCAALPESDSVPGADPAVPRAPN